jgi:hypothetical protein
MFSDIEGQATEIFPWFIASTFQMYLVFPAPLMVALVSRLKGLTHENMLMMLFL